ncbi:hypothetical protein MNV_2170011 [Candidatus Methanoperedens nitroreducens]|uniref:Uncharacterized protein n=1 Tax=Candidatus Methanoperedens nitratireducens TaxID=1392998 RepID=A0A284VNW9_9EURY|nr:hypothetical protein MNV_2170011 [Candidatus Methanoperedens nitroreducens]
MLPFGLLTHSVTLLGQKNGLPCVGYILNESTILPVVTF